ncbi:MAG: dockerin type I repeat-containing protein, partial [Tepidisphaeraceae bacterium]
SALLAATDGDTIWIAGGTYKPTTTTDRTVSFALRNAVAIYGGYAGYGTPNPNARNTVAYPTILSGDIGTINKTSDDSYHVLTATGLGSSTVLNSLTVSGGNANGAGANQAVGGGLLASVSSPTLISCIFSGNTATGSGGGLYNSVSSPTLTNCTFSGNAATVGGAIYAYYSAPILTNCTLSGSSALSSGGGLYNSGSNPKLTNCIIWGSGNSPIYNSLSTPVITYSDIQGGYSGTGNINADPLFVRNPSAGPDGIWGTADDDYGDLRLLSSSPAINAGSNAAIPTGVTTDLAGNARVVNTTVDMGAYEYGPGTLTFVGTAASDAAYARLSADGTQFQVWNGPTPTGTPAGTYPVATPLGFVFDMQGGNNSLTLDICNGLPAVPVNFVAGTGTDTVTITGTGPADTVSFQASKILLDSATLFTTGVETRQIDGPAGSVISLGSLTASTPVTLIPMKSLVVNTNSLSITGSGSLDLAGNAMILIYGGSSPMPQVQQWINNGRIGVTPALKTTSTVASGIPALGMVDNALLHLASFAGHSLSGVFSQLLIQSTVAGDTNLDGKVDQSDYVNIIANMGSTNAQWFLGDLNGDGLVTPDDLAVVAANLGAGASIAAGPSLATASPANPAMAAMAVSEASPMIDKSVAATAKPAVHAKKPVPHHKQPKVIHSATKHI